MQDCSDGDWREQMKMIKYEEPQMEYICFDENDIVTVSGLNDIGNETEEDSREWGGFF